MNVYYFDKRAPKGERGIYLCLRRIIFFFLFLFLRSTRPVCECVMRGWERGESNTSLGYDSVKKTTTTTKTLHIRCIRCKAEKKVE